MDVLHGFFWTGLLLLAALGTGLWVSGLGRPLNPPLSGIHKLLALAWVVVATFRIWHTARLSESSPVLIVVVGVLGLTIVALIASGSVLTVPNEKIGTWLAVHRIATVIAVAAFIVTLRMSIIHKP